ncbi:MAG TPA: acyl-CoA dehydrogenase family protein [Candidatus Binatia bacterium]|nr:acyl-CoA dehydrogenase family protein [Candidatus Binatia bacterium]
MRIELTEAQRQLRDAVRAFARERLAPAAAEVDRSERFPREQVAGLARLGVLGCFVPERFGGAGFDHVAYALAMEEVAAGCAATATVLAAHASLATWPILALGTDAQRERYLPRLATGEWLGCFALSEPGAGSDAGAIRTTARRDGEGWVLGGTKNFITNAPDASLAIVFASLDPARGNKGLGAFLVETASPGWQILRVEEKMGIRGAHSAQLALTDVRVPRDALLGGEGEGFKVAMRTLDGGRIGIAAQAVGIARAAFEASLAYVGERRAFGQRLADFQATQFRLADMAAAVEAARLLTLHAAFRKDRGLPYGKEAAMAKLYAAETAMTVATQAVQLHGGYGYTREFPVERHFRDAKITEIYEGTSEIQRLVIASRLLREASAA